MACRITVHDFVAVGSASTSRTALRVEQGRDLALACSGSHRWVTPGSTIESSAFTLRRDRLYQYRSGPPPLIPGTRPIISIPDWGQPSLPGDSDYFRLQGLPEFESTDFQASSIPSGANESEHSPYRKRVQEDGSGVNEPVKRPHIEYGSILDLVPQPHFIPSPAAKFQPVDTKKIPHYEKSLPLPIAPYDAAAVDQLLSGRFRRAAWLIPVRGSLPWDGASTAAILDQTQAALYSSPCPSVSATQPNEITWTPVSLQHLWTFLGSIQKAKHLGPLSLSFHAAPADAVSARDTASEPVWESNRPYYYMQQLSKHTSSPSDNLAMDICRARLEDTDYIKIYHDVPYSLSLRNILDAYRYEPVNGEVGRSGVNDRKIRILKGAHLVLMDERSKAAFLM